LNEDWLYKIALSKIPGVGGVIARNLVSYSGGAREVFRMRKTKLRRIPGVGEKIATAITDPAVLRDAERELRTITANDIRCLFYLDEDYPQRLRPYPHSPVLLYTCGDVDLNPARAVAIVGTRQPTPYGRTRCEHLVQGLMPYAPLIISGLAYGIDIIAHRTAIKCGLATIGILGSGFSYVYPRSHIPVGKQMMKKGGLVTEFGFGTGPDRENFPARNRIVAGLADVLVVVESGKRGGSMITAGFADVYHKDVCAFPGRADDKTSEGCNYLIKSHKAHLAESAEDIVELLRWDMENPERVVQRTLFEDLSEPEQLLMEVLEEDGETDIDSLAARSQMHLGELSAVLLSLEFKGVVRALPGKRYIVVSP
jgi:DNA processing protein